MSAGAALAHHRANGQGAMNNPQLNAEGRLQHLLTTEGLPRDILLRHVATRTYKGGLVQSEYELGAAESSSGSVSG